MVKTYGQLFLDARSMLLAVEAPAEAGRMARELICRESGQTPEYVLANRDLYTSEEICDRVLDDAKRLISGEPLAYVLGEWDFFGLTLHVSPDVLIPRDDTCAVATLAIKQGLFLDQSPRILDLCCGSGCIGLAVAARVKDARVTMGDLS